MEANLMDKEVLCILDTRQIQMYLFRNNSLRDVLGGSDVMDHIQMDAIHYALTHMEPALTEKNYALSLDPHEEIPWFHSPDIQFQLFYCSAGNAICLVRTGRLCQQLLHRMSRYYLEHGYSLNLTVAVTEKTDNLRQDLFELYNRLNEVKASGDVLEPQEPLSVVAREKWTGLPAIGRDEQGAYYGRASAIRRKEAALRETVVDFSDIRTTRGPDGRDYLAVIHSDGNNLGITIGRLMRSTTSYEDGIHLRRLIASTIDEKYGCAVDKTIADMRAYWETLPAKKKSVFEQSFYVVHRGGDDLNVICDASMAIPFMNLLYKNLKGAVLWQSDDFTAPVYVCSGIAFVTKGSNFHSAFVMAEECCDRAKIAAKRETNLRNGFAGNWIDFQVYPEPQAQSLDIIREQSYVSASGRNMLLRPYCIDPEAEDKAYAWGKLMERTERLRQLGLSKSTLDEVHRTCMTGGYAFRHWLEVLKRKGVDLVSELGEAMEQNEEGTMSYAWLDAAELSGFFADEG